VKFHNLKLVLVDTACDGIDLIAQIKPITLKTAH